MPYTAETKTYPPGAVDQVVPERIEDADGRPFLIYRIGASIFIERIKNSERRRPIEFDADAFLLAITP